MITCGSDITEFNWREGVSCVLTVIMGIVGSSVFGVWSTPKAIEPTTYISDLKLIICDWITMSDLYTMQPAVSSLLLKCVIHVPEAGKTLHGARQTINGHQCFQKGSMRFHITLSMWYMISVPTLQFKHLGWLRNFILQIYIFLPVANEFLMIS